MGQFNIMGFAFPVVTGGSTPTPGTPSPDLLHSPADVLRWALIALSTGSDPSADAAWPLYTGSEPAQPDNVITTYDTQGRGDGRSHIDGEGWDHHGVQVRVRSTSHVVGYTRARLLLVAMDRSINNTVVSVGTTDYLIRAVTRVGDVISIGKETPTSKRNVFTINVLVSVELLED